MGLKKVLQASLALFGVRLVRQERFRSVLTELEDQRAAAEQAAAEQAAAEQAADHWRVELAARLRAIERRLDERDPRPVLAEQTQATSASIATQADLTRATVCAQSEITRAAVGEQCGLTRAELAEVTRIARHQAEAGWDWWKIQEVETLLRYLRRQQYLEAIRTGALDVPRLETEHPLAVDSNDTIHPRGAKNDNSICPRFNQRLYQLFGRRPGLRVLDLGCAGGGLVRTLIDDGHFAVGLDGSDYPLVNQTGEWGTVPHHLHTCDVTRPYRLTSARTGEPLLFDAITAWEVMEHIPEDRIDGLLENVGRHLAPGGYVLLSIATFLDWDEATGVVWHVTVKPREWWADRFAAAGFVPVADHPFGKHDWLRGAGNGRHDWQADDKMGFHLALRRRSEVGAVAA